MHNCANANKHCKYFFDFIKDVIKNLTEKDYIFLFDNIGFHKNKEMLQYITDNGHKYMFTPPYSPNLNPIENTFGIIKNIYKKNQSDKSITTKKTVKNIGQTIDEFSNSDINTEKIFNRAFNYNYAIEEKELRDILIIIDKHKKVLKEKIKKEKTKKRLTKEEKIKQKEDLLAKNFQRST